jgi:tetratricopeptide (TPR) repeat protein
VTFFYEEGGEATVLRKWRHNPTPETEEGQLPAPVDIYQIRRELLARAAERESEERAKAAAPKSPASEAPAKAANVLRDIGEQLGPRFRAAVPSAGARAGLAFRGRVHWSDAVRGVFAVARRVAGLLRHGGVAAGRWSAWQASKLLARAAALARDATLYLIAAWRGKPEAPAPPVVEEPAPPPDPIREEILRAEERVAAKERHLGSDTPEIAAELHFIGALHHQQGRYDEAVSFYERALAIRERTLGADHPEVAATLEDLAAAREDQGAAEEAERLHTRALEIHAMFAGLLARDPEGALR